MHRARRNRCHIPIDINSGEQAERRLGLQFFQTSMGFGCQVCVRSNNLEFGFSERRSIGSASYEQHATSKRIPAARATDGVITDRRCNRSAWRNTCTGDRLPTLRRREAAGQRGIC